MRFFYAAKNHCAVVWRGFFCILGAQKLLNSAQQKNEKEKFWYGNKWSHDKCMFSNMNIGYSIIIPISTKVNIVDYTDCYVTLKIPNFKYLVSGIEGRTGWSGAAPRHSR